MSARMICLHGHPWEPNAEREVPSVCPVCGAPFEGPARLPRQDDPGATLASDQVPAGRDDLSLTLSPEVSVAAAVRTAVSGYEILSELGRGGMGVVYKARHMELNRLVALKMVLSGVHVSPRELARFRSEAAAVAALQHPNIVQVYEVGEQDGRPYFALEFVDGGSLALRLGAPLPPRWSAQMVEQLARTIHFAHQRGIVHRDLKPANILMASAEFGARNAEQESGISLRTSSSEFRIPKITDFGLAKHIQTGGALTQSGTVLGTPSYMAPEQALGKNREVGPAADIYALGAILYEMLTGRPPFRAETSLDTMLQVASEEPAPLSRLQPRLPRDLQTICLKCLNKEPWNRYATAEALAEDLQRFLGGEPIRTRPVGTAERLVKWARRRPSLAALILLAVCSGIAGFALMCWEWNEEKNRRENLQAAQIEKDQTLARAEASLYFHRIALAEREFLANRLGRARHLLQECPPDLRRWEWRYLNRLCSSDLLTLRGHDNAVYFLTFSPDGRLLASASLDQTIKVWDAVNGKMLGSRKEGLPRDRSGVLAFGPSSHQLHFARANEAVKTWELFPEQNGRPVGKPLHGATAIAFGPDRRVLAMGNREGMVRVWDTRAAKPRFQVKPHAGPVLALAFSPGGKLLASADRNGTIKVCNSINGDELHLLTGHTGSVYGLAFSSDGLRLASAGADGIVRVWDSRTGKPLWILHGHTKPVACVSFSPGGRYLASGSHDRTVKMWDMTTGEETFTLRGHTRAVLCLAFRPGGKVLASAGDDRAIKLWDATTGQEAQTFKASYACQTIAYSPDGKYITTADGNVKLWEAGNHDPVRAFAGPEEFIEAMIYRPDGKLLATAGKKGLKLWDPANGTLIATLRGSTCHERGVAYSPDGRYLASAGNDGVVRIWDGSGRLLHVLNGHAGSVTSVAFSSDGTRLASASLDHTVRLWDPANGQEQAVLNGHVGPVRVVAFSPRGDCLVSGGVNQNPDESEGMPEGELKVWDVDTGIERHALMGHAAAITGLAFTPDGSRLASASEDLTIKLWDPILGQEVLTLRGGSGHAEALAFSPDGLTLAAVNLDQTVRLWTAAPVP